jgi:hypothetical protein
VFSPYVDSVGKGLTACFPVSHGNKDNTMTTFLFYFLAGASAHYFRHVQNKKALGGGKRLGGTPPIQQ